MHKFMIAAAALCALATAPAAAQAQIGKLKVVHSVIRYDPAALARADSAERMFKRIRLHATQLCRPDGQARVQAGLSAETRACRDRAVARAVQDLAAPLVTDAFERRTAREIASR